MARIFLFFLIVNCDVRALILKQVLILGRHNMRTPLANDLNDYTLKKWPQWIEDPGQITAKGVRMESYIAEYFAQWLNQNNFTGCPEPDSIIVYANSPQRTIKTAETFVKIVFPFCDVSVYYKHGVDSVFYPLIQNDTYEFRQTAKEEMKKTREQFDLTNAYTELNKLLNLDRSPKCENESFCDFLTPPDEFIVNFDEEPKVPGPLFVATKVMDTFLMQYYNNTFYSEEVAWGDMTEKKLRLLSIILKANLHTRFKPKSIADDVTKPILKYMANILKDERVKFTLLVGHDSTQNAVLSTLRFKPYVLPDQYEITPIGGKIVFQKWHEEISSTDLLKVEYVYQSREQLRDGTKLSKSMPPKSKVLVIEGCDVDNNGYCQWIDFDNIIKNYLD